MKFKNIAPRIYRGSHPKSKLDFMFLKYHGIKTILNLESGLWEKLIGDVNFEVQEASKYGIDVIHLHMGYIFPPSKKQLDAAINIIDLHVIEKNNIFFHCYSGVDRTGFVASVVNRTYNKMNDPEIINSLWSNGFHWFYWWWVPSLKKYLWR